MQKLSEETYTLVTELLELEYNSCNHGGRRKEIEDALAELDAIGIY